MVNTGRYRKRAWCAAAALLSLILAVDAFAGLPATWGKRKPSTWDGGFSAEGFSCEAREGEGTTNIEIRNGKPIVVFDGKVDCTVLGKGTRTCDLHVEHSNVTDNCLTNPSQFPPGTEGSASVQRYTQSCPTAKTGDITGFVECGAEAASVFDTCDGTEGDEIDCGIKFGIAGGGDPTTGGFDPLSTCESIFGTAENALLDVSIGYLNDSSCGLDPAATAAIDFETGGCDTAGVVDPISTALGTSGNSVRSTFNCLGTNNDDENCYYMGYGGSLRTSHVGPAVPGCGTRDTTADAVPGTCAAEGLGLCAMADEQVGPDDTDDVYLSFDTEINGLSVDLIDFRQDGRAYVGDTMTLNAYADDAFGDLLGSTVYTIDGAEEDGFITNLSVPANGIRSASLVIGSEEGDVGASYDNFEFSQSVTTQVFTALSRACGSNDTSVSGTGGFLTDPSFVASENCDINTPETTGSVTPEIELPEESILCTGKFTRRRCGAHKPTITIIGAFLTGNEVARKTVDIDGKGFGGFNCRATDVAGLDDDGKPTLERDGVKDYVCRATCSVRQYNQVKRLDSVDATLTGLTKAGDNFLAACTGDKAFPVN